MRLFRTFAKGSIEHMRTYKPTIGLEIHAELSTKSKMFCGCKNDPHGSEPNTNICPVCMAHPGTLPTVNNDAVEKVVTVGVALGGEIATYSEFDRKNYFYPDIPKAYQISQYQFPFVRGGELAGVAITRVHLEEDTARSQHEGGHSIVDFNRAGVPLMELVTEPVIHDAETAGKFARELQLMLRTLGVSDANMERGEMRVEANISVSPDDTLRTKVEVKNLNSFKAVEAAIAYEIDRQIHIYEQGEAGRDADSAESGSATAVETVIQETRGWDDQKGVTFSQRTKETAEDYRYFPDPDIPRFDLEKAENIRVSRIKENLPKLPNEKRTYWTERGIAAEKAELLVIEPVLGSYAEAVVDALPATSTDNDAIGLAVNYLTSDIFGLLQEQQLFLEPSSAPRFAALMTMLTEGKLTSRVAKDLLKEVVFEGADPQKVSEERGLLQQNSADELGTIVEAIIVEHAGVAAEYKAGKEASLQFLIGQGMKATKGAANPQMLAKLFKEKLQ